MPYHADASSPLSGGGGSVRYGGIGRDLVDLDAIRSSGTAEAGQLPPANAQRCLPVSGHSPQLIKCRPTAANQPKATAEMGTDGLPRTTRLTLSRPDLSAREAVAIIADQVGDGRRHTKAFSVAIAGAADVNGRLNIAVGGWDVRFLTLHPDQYIYARLFANGNLSFTRESMWDVPPPAFALDGEWIDSTLAAEIIKGEPLPPTMGERYSLFLSLRFFTDVGLTWQVMRIYTEPANSLHVTQSFGINASSRDIAAETIEMKKAGVLVESRYRHRLDDDEWVDKLEH